MEALTYNQFMNEHYYNVTPMNRFKRATENQNITRPNVAYNIGDSMVYIWNPENITSETFISHRKYICALYVQSGEVKLSVTKRDEASVCTAYCDLNDEEHLTCDDYQTISATQGQVVIINLTDAYRIESVDADFVIGRISKDGGVK